MRDSNKNIILDISYNTFQILVYKWTRHVEIVFFFVQLCAELYIYKNIATWKVWHKYCCSLTQRSNFFFLVAESWKFTRRRLIVFQVPFPSNDVRRCARFRFGFILTFNYNLLIFIFSGRAICAMKKHSSGEMTK